MIPQKKKEADLEKQLDDDIKKAENNSKEILKDNKPKLAQAVAKIFKICHYRYYGNCGRL